MPGFNVGGIGANRTGAEDEPRVYASYTWEIPNIFFGGGSFTPARAPEQLLRTAQLPSVDFDKVQAQGGAHKYSYAGEASYPDITISWYDTFGLITSVNQWYESCYRPESGIGIAIGYKRRTLIRKYLTDREDLGVAAAGGVGIGPTIVPGGGTPDDESVEYELFGAWPKAIKESDLTYLEASVKFVELTISYDYYRINRIT